MSRQSSPKRAVFSSEAKLCETFIWSLPDGWKSYPETAGFDILLVRLADSVQVGIEAKLSLNAKVIDQIVEPSSHWYSDSPGPDYRAALIPYGTTGSFGRVCRLLGITVIEQSDRAVWEHETKNRHKRYRDGHPKFKPQLPGLQDDHWRSWQEDWIDWAPSKRCVIPAYVPDVGAGHSAPIQLTPWKIKALKVAAIIEVRGHVTRADFKALQINPDRWINPHVGWLSRAEEKGKYLVSSKVEELRRQHPRNYAEILADYEKWIPKSV